MLKHSAETSFETRTELTADGGHWSLASTPRYRINVLELLYTFGSRAETSHIFCYVDMSRVEERRQKFKAAGKKVTVTAFLLKAIARAQRNFPDSRTLATPGGGRVICNNVTAGFTVERLMPGGPAVFFGEIENPDKKSLFEISDQLKLYAEGEINQIPKLKQQKFFAELPWFVRKIILTAAIWFPGFRLKCMGATFGLSSLGALGAEVAFGPSVCTSIFGVGAVREHAVVIDGKIAIKPMMSLTLSYDQLIMDAGNATRFLAEAKEILESMAGEEEEAEEEAEEQGQEEQEQEEQEQEEEEKEEEDDDAAAEHKEDDD